MRRILLVAGLCIVALSATSQPGFALDRGADGRNPSASDLSAAKKNKQRHPVTTHKAASPVYATRRGWADPSFGPDGKLYPNPYPPHICSTDMGYGRFSTCDFHE